MLVEAEVDADDITDIASSGDDNKSHRRRSLFVLIVMIMYHCQELDGRASLQLFHSLNFTTSLKSMHYKYTLKTTVLEK